PQQKDLRTAFTYQDGTCTIVNALGDVFKDNYESLMVQLQQTTSDDKADPMIIDRIRILDDVYKHVRKIRENTEKTVENSRIKSEWMFAAIVVDRLGLIIFLFLL